MNGRWAIHGKWRRLASMTAAVVVTVATSMASASADPAPADVCTGDPSHPSSAELVQYLRTHFPTQRLTSGMTAASIAVVTPTAMGVVNCGVLGKTNGAATNSQTVYEIGSQTKLFTAAALAVLLAQSPPPITLQTPITDYFPSVDMKQCGTANTFNTRAMTLQSLVGYGSGLPDLPPGLGVRARYSWTDLYASLGKPPSATNCLKFPPGQGYLYSDWGFALLGGVLASHANPPAPNQPRFGAVPSDAYGRVIGSSITAPLGLTATQIEQSPPPPQQALPQCPNGSENCYWNNTFGFAGGGGLVSTILDMATFLRDNFSTHTGALRAELQRMQNVVNTDGGTCGPRCQSGMAWSIAPTGAPFSNAPKLVTKDGGTSGAKSQTYLFPEKCWGVTVLTNGSTNKAVGAPGTFAGDLVANQLAVEGPRSYCSQP